MIRVGIGGWTYAPWRDNFYPKGLAQAKELEFASRAVSAIEINATFYGTQRRTSFVRWVSETPDDFVFSVKGPRFATNRANLDEAGSSITRFMDSGVLELGRKLGPLLWQLPPYKKFFPTELTAFFELLLRTRDGVSLRHAVEVRHASFRDPSLIQLARQFGIAKVTVDSGSHPLIADATADFAYARLQRCEGKIPTGYKPEDLKTWAARASAWAKGEVVKGLDLLAPDGKAVHRDVFVFMISGAKERAPAAALALRKLLSR